MSEAEMPNAPDGWGAPAGSASARPPAPPRPSPDYEGAPGFPPATPENGQRGPTPPASPPSPGANGARQRATGRYERVPERDPSRSPGRYQRGGNGDQRVPTRYPLGQEGYERRSAPRTPGGYPTARGGSGLATTGPPPLGVPGPLAGTPARVESRVANVPGPPPGPLVRPQRTPVRRVAAPPPPQPMKARRIRLVEKFGGRRLHHHASPWRRIRSLLGILLIGLVVAAIIATVIAVIVGVIALAVQHALH